VKPVAEEEAGLPAENMGAMAHTKIPERIYRCCPWISVASTSSLTK
jgi:hypothetical protein